MKSNLGKEDDRDRGDDQLVAGAEGAASDMAVRVGRRSFDRRPVSDFGRRQQAARPSREGATVKRCLDEARRRGLRPHIMG